MKQDGKATDFKPTIDKVTGQIAVNISRHMDLGGISGSGTLMTATFKAKNEGPAAMGFVDVNFTALGGKPLETLSYSSVVEVK